MGAIMTKATRGKTGKAKRHIKQKKRPRSKEARTPTTITVVTKGVVQCVKVRGGIEYRVYETVEEAVAGGRQGNVGLASMRRGTSISQMQVYPPFRWTASLRNLQPATALVRHRAPAGRQNARPIK